MSKKKWNISKENSHDKRTISSVQKSFNNLIEKFSTKEIQKTLGITPQKFGALKKQIKQGKVYGKENKDQIERVDLNLSEKKIAKEIKEKKRKELKERKELNKKWLKELNEQENAKQKTENDYLYRKSFDVSYYDSPEEIKTSLGSSYKIASYPQSSFDDMYTWFKKVGGGREYFGILREDDLFYVVDIDPNRTREGTKNKKIVNYETHWAEMIYQKWLSNQKGLT